MVIRRDKPFPFSRQDPPYFILSPPCLVLMTYPLFSLPSSRPGILLFLDSLSPSFFSKELASHSLIRLFSFAFFFFL